MRLLATAIIWTAGMALASNENSKGEIPPATANVFAGVGKTDVTYQVTFPRVPAFQDWWIFVPTISQPGITIQCSWANKIKLRMANLRRYNSSAGVLTSSGATAPDGVASPSPNGLHAVKVETMILDVGQTARPRPNDAEVVRREQPTPLTVIFLTQSGTTNTQVEITIPDARNYAMDREPVYLELVWSPRDSPSSLTTSSFTPLFGIVDNISKAANLTNMPNIGKYSDSSSPFNDATNDGAGIEAKLPKSTSPSTDGLAGSNGGGSGGNTDNIAPGSPSPSATVSAEPVSSGGLAQGAIIGIAVAAAIVGLALIGFLVFWLLRRHRRQQSDHVSTARPYRRDQHTATADLMGEKEAAAGGIGESPHSPYSDDGHGSLPPHRGIAAPAAAAAAGAAAGAGTGAAIAHHGSSPAPASADLHRSSFTPYSDDGTHTGVPSVHTDADRATGARSETPGGGRYEHLMEQGMSAAERQRVEEEERQLDAEIEQRSRK